MKLFKITHKLGEPLKREINLSTDSTALVGINWLNADGNAYNPDADSLKVNGSAPEIVELEGVAYTCFQISAGDAPNVTDYEVTWSKTETGALTGKAYGFTFKVVTADRNVAEVGGVGGGGGDFVPTNDTIEGEEQTATFEYGKIVDDGYGYISMTLSTTYESGSNSNMIDDMGLTMKLKDENGEESNATLIDYRGMLTREKDEEVEGYINESEVTPSFVEVRRKSVQGVMEHITEIKHDGVYVDDNGYKPLTISMTDTEGNQISFKSLVNFFKFISPADWFTMSEGGLSPDSYWIVEGFADGVENKHKIGFPEENTIMGFTKPVKAVDEDAFTEDGEINEVYGKSIIQTSYRSFADCVNLTKIDFPNIEDVGNESFAGCSSLKEVSFPEATSIGENAFYECYELTEVSIPKATSIGEYAFSNCPSLTELNLSNSTMAQVKAMENFPWGVDEFYKRIVCSDGWVDYEGGEHPYT